MSRRGVAIGITSLPNLQADREARTVFRFLSPKYCNKMHTDPILSSENAADFFHLPPDRVYEVSQVVEI